MKKTFITLLAALTMLTACNLEGEEPLEEGVMTPDEFFDEIGVEAKDLTDGWWQYCFFSYGKDEKGNYRAVPHYGPYYLYFYNVQNGEILAIKRCDFMLSDWTDIAISEPVKIVIGDQDRTLSVGTPVVPICGETLVKCNSDFISSIDLESGTKHENGMILYDAHSLGRIGNELPKHREPSYYDENGVAVYE